MGFKSIRSYFFCMGAIIEAAVESAKADYERLRFLDALIECGVDNWSGWGDAHSLVDGEENEDED